MTHAVKVKPIRGDAEHDAALIEIQQLWGSKPGTSNGDRLDVLVALVEAYERQQPPLRTADPIELIRFQMAQRRLRTSDLVPAIGPLSRVSEILNRRRSLTLEMIRRLQDLLDIPAGALVQPYRLSRPRSLRGRPARAA
ncbi:MAG: transcriptional regulator [Proteobacteria bacterium]|nr:transcriptional regulator [Pseudomonadota bacterium]